MMLWFVVYGDWSTVWAIPPRDANRTTPPTMLTFAIVFALRWKSWAIPACPATRAPAFPFEASGGPADPPSGSGRRGRGRRDRPKS
jgi:hypothetical protein